FFSKSKTNELYIEEINGSLVVYFLRNAHKNNPILELFFPPLPMNENVLKKAQEKIYNFRKEKKSNILWVDEQDKAIVSKYFRIIKREEEYIFSFDNLNELKGAMLKNLRYNLKRFSKVDNVEIRDYCTDDYFECILLLKEWKKKQKDKYNSINDLEYTKNCLRLFDKFSNNDLFGKVVLINNKIKAFGFAGEVYEEVANLFIIKADPFIRGLSYFIKYKILEELKDYKYVNDSSDLGYEGLKESKKSFNPKHMHKIYKARDGF
ncbi:phosphatidylglycerol lysyltransferase domain-containing protein, partial [Poseidonibacter sp.]|uniref:phosphatidylglycerol lysyltransferase domain-containing protein n=1 Tax=Poseidonibacter sp. TaxID=2321188 RepID=UPI003C7851F1